MAASCCSPPCGLPTAPCVIVCDGPADGAGVAALAAVLTPLNNLPPACSFCAVDAVSHHEAGDMFAVSEVGAAAVVAGASATAAAPSGVFQKAGDPSSDVEGAVVAAVAPVSAAAVPSKGSDADAKV